MRGGFERFAISARTLGLRCGLGTAGDRHNVRFCLERLPKPDLDGLFEVCVGGDEGLPGKPDPAIFLAVAQRMAKRLLVRWPGCLVGASLDEQAALGRGRRDVAAWVAHDIADPEPGPGKPRRIDIAASLGREERGAIHAANRGPDLWRNNG